MIAPLSTLNSTRPPLTSLIARSRSNVIVPDFGFGIRPRRPRILPSRPTMPIVSGRRQRDVELEPAGLDLLDQVLGADLVGAGAERLLGLLALGEHGDPDDLARAVRQDDRAADHLVGVARVDAEPEVGLDRRVEVDGARLLGERRRLVRRVDRVAVDELRRVLEVFLAVAMCCSSVGRLPASPWRGRRAAGVAPRPRAGRALADDLDAHAAGGALDLAGRGLDVVGVEVGHLDLGDLADLVAGDPADGLALRSWPRPCRCPAALRRRSAAGGVLRMNVNERSSKTVIWAGMIWPALSAVFSL